MVNMVTLLPTPRHLSAPAAAGAGGRPGSGM